MSLLELDDVSAGYGSFQALFGITLRVEEGQTFAIIGANGAGKSTLLRTISGLLRTAAREGPSRRTTDRRARRPSAGGTGHLDGARGAPDLPQPDRAREPAGRRARQAARAPGAPSAVYELFPLLARLRGRQASSLSGGEQQALAIGRGLMSNPRLLLLDEVSLGLAPIMVRSLYQAMPAIVESGITILLVEQDIGQAVAVADYVTCLLEGRVALEGRPADLTREQITTAYFGT